MIIEMHCYEGAGRMPGQRLRRWPGILPAPMMCVFILADFYTRYNRICHIGQCGGVCPLADVSSIEYETWTRILRRWPNIKPTSSLERTKKRRSVIDVVLTDKCLSRLDTPSFPRFDNLDTPSFPRFDNFMGTGDLGEQRVYFNLK